MVKAFKARPQPLVIRMLRMFTREILIPVFLAILVIQFVIQAFKIPSGSMEDSLLVGDFLLGIKFIYGPPLPYSDKRLPSLVDPGVGDILIFRYPGEPEYPDYNRERYAHVANLLMFGNYYWDRTPAPGQNRLVHFPDGPKDFIKRVVAKSGQTVHISGGQLSVNGQLQPLPDRGKFTAREREPTVRDFLGPFYIPSPGDTIFFDRLSLEQLWWIRSLMLQENPGQRVEMDLQIYEGGKTGGRAVSQKVFANFRVPLFNHKGFLITHILNQSKIMPYNLRIGDTLQGRVDFSFFQQHARTGFIPRPPLPGQGSKRIVGYDYFDGSLLSDLEYNVSLLNDSLQNFSLVPTILVDGKPVTNYVVQHPSYLMLGDNRDNSSDGRYWGLLSRRNVRARAFVIYFSLDSSETIDKQSGFSLRNILTIPLRIRWNRIGKLVHAN